MNWSINCIQVNIDFPSLFLLILIHSKGKEREKEKRESEERKRVRKKVRYNKGGSFFLIYEHTNRFFLNCHIPKKPFFQLFNDIKTNTVKNNIQNTVKKKLYNFVDSKREKEKEKNNPPHTNFSLACKKNNN